MDLGTLWQTDLHWLNQLNSYMDRRGNLFENIGRRRVTTPRQDEDMIIFNLKFPRLNKDALNQSMENAWENRELK